MSDPNEQQGDKLRRLFRERGGKMPHRVARAVRSVLGEPDGEITHDQCRAAFPACVDVVLEGGRITDRYPAVKRHLDACEECAEEYAEMLDLALQENAGKIPMGQNIPAPDLSFLPGATPPPAPQPPITFGPVWVFAKQKAADLAAALTTISTQDFVTAANDFFDDLRSKGLERTLEPIAEHRGDMAEADRTKVTIAVTYTAIKALVEELTPERIDALAAQGRLCEELEARAQGTVLEIGVDRAFGWQVASELAKQLCQDRKGLQQLMHRS